MLSDHHNWIRGGCATSEKSDGSEIVLERMDLPANECYRLVVLDSFGDDAGSTPHNTTATC